MRGLDVAMEVWRLLENLEIDARSRKPHQATVVANQFPTAAPLLSNSGSLAVPSWKFPGQYSHDNNRAGNSEDVVQGGNRVSLPSTRIFIISNHHEVVR